MTMDFQSHHLFDQLELSFEATVGILLSLSKLNFLTHAQASPNCYKIRRRKIYHKIKDEVIFTVTNPELPLPSPHLIPLHAACAKAAQLSGASEYIDHIYSEMESISELAHEGTSSDALHHAIMTLRPQTSR